MVENIKFHGPDLTSMMSRLIPITDIGNADKDSEDHLVSSWVIAVLLCIISAFVINFGVNLQKLAWNKHRKHRNDTSCDESRRNTMENNNLIESPGGQSLGQSGDIDLRRIQPSINQRTSHIAMNGTSPETINEPVARKKNSNENNSRKMWILGFFCIGIGSLFDFAALGFGAQSIVAPLGSTSLCANIIFAQVMLGEKLSKRDLHATAVIFIGCVLSVAFASHEDENYEIDTLLALYTKPRFSFYASVVILLLTLGCIGVRHIESVARLHGYRSREYSDLYNYHRFSYTFLSGLAGAQSVLFAKSLDELIVASFRGNSKVFLAHFGSYLIVTCMLATITLQIYWLNCALARWDALYVVPVFQAQWIVYNVLGGGIFYDEFRDFSFGQATGFLIGITFTVFGVYYMSQRGSGKSRNTGYVDEGEGTTATAQEDVINIYSEAAHSSKDRFDNLEDTLDTPLLEGAHNSVTKFYSPLSAAFVNNDYIPRAQRRVVMDYDVTFHNRLIGLSLQLEKLRPFSSSVWRVSANSNGQNHPVKPGHIIIAIDGVSVLCSRNHADMQRLLDAVVVGPRPVTIRFRTEYTADHPSATGSSLSSTISADSMTPRSSLVCHHNEDYTSDDDDIAEAESSRFRNRSSLQGVPLNPLLNLIHSWKDIGPQAFDRISLNDNQTMHDPDHSDIHTCPGSLTMPDALPTSSNDSVSFYDVNVAEKEDQCSGNGSNSNGRE